MYFHIRRAKLAKRLAVQANGRRAILERAVVALPAVAGLIAPEHKGGRGAFALVEQPIDGGADVVLAGFAHDA